MRKLVSVCTVVALLLTIATAPVAAGKAQPTFAWSVCDPGSGSALYRVTVSWAGFKLHDLTGYGSTTASGTQVPVQGYDVPGKVKSPLQWPVTKSAFAGYTWMWVYAETHRGDRYDDAAQLISAIPPC
jgi:hypothetical protein